VHPQLAVLAFELAQPCALRQRQRRFLILVFFFQAFTQFPSVASLSPSSRVTCAIGRGGSMTIFTASCRYSGENLLRFVTRTFPFRKQYTLFGSTVRKVRGHIIPFVRVEPLTVPCGIDASPLGDGLRPSWIAIATEEISVRF
jgi:hypothetical protein